MKHASAIGNGTIYTSSLDPLDDDLPAHLPADGG